MDIIHPTDRPEGHGTNPKAEQDLVNEAINEYASGHDTKSVWKRRLLDTPHFAALHLFTGEDDPEEPLKGIERSLFDKGYERLDIETFGQGHAVITIVNKEISGAGEVCSGPG